jgi:hypothetical protein
MWQMLPNWCQKGSYFNKWKHHATHFFFLAFYAFESPLFYNHCNCEGNIIVIPFAMGTYQGDPLGRALFKLKHFKVLHSILNYFPFILFIFI